VESVAPVGRELGKGRESVNCPPVGAPALAALALVDDQELVDQESVSCRPDSGPEAAALWRERSARVRARRFCPDWATAREELASDQANFPIERHRSVATTCKTVSHRAMIALKTATIAYKIGRTAAMKFAKTGKIAMTISTTATMIGITAVGMISVVGGITCGTNTPR
jgi:hypothetical protein